LVESGVVTCADPSRRDEAVFDRLVLGPDEWEGPWEEQGLLTGAVGVAVADLDGDGIDDLFVPRFDHPSELLLGTGDGGFVVTHDRTDVSVEEARGVSAADLEGDGDVDLVVYSILADPVVLRNDGTAHFVVEPLLPPHDGEVGCGASVSFADADLDGDLDLFHGRVDTPGTDRPCDSFLLFNDGDGRSFTDRSDMLSADVHANRVLAAGWLPLDDDPYPELYVVADAPLRSPGNRVLDNDGGVLRQVDDHPLNLSMEGMGIGLAHLDDDDIVDVFVPGIDEYAVMVSLADADTWVDHSSSWGLAPDRSAGQSVAWGGDFADLDNDGLVDLPVVYGPTSTTETGGASRQPDAIHRQVSEGVWESVAESWGWADPIASRSVLAVDLDDNGFLDLVKREVGGRVYVDLARCDTSAWLSLTLHQPGRNPRAVGATVEVWAEGRRHWRSVVQGSTSYSAGQPAEVHIGLGGAEVVDRVVVTWPDGERVEYAGVATRQKVEVLRP
jgi:hypothetical protein